MRVDQGSAVHTLKTKLLADLVQYAEQQGWSEAEAAQRFRVTLPRVQELLRAKVDRFCLDDLVSMAGHAELRIRLTVAT